MNANEMQVGGSHYNNGSDYQHWDMCIDINLGYLESAATKYLSRHWKKNGMEDVKKSFHYITKVKEAFVDARIMSNQAYTASPRRNQALDHAISNFNRFVEGNDIPPAEKAIMWRIVTWRTEDDLSYVLKEITYLINDLYMAPLDTSRRNNGPAPTKTPSDRVGRAEGAVEHPAPFGYDGNG